MTVSTDTLAVRRKAPVTATWICIAIAWLMFLLPIPGAGLFVGWPLNLVAFILAIVVMARGRTAGGLVPLLASLVASPVVYFVGVAIFAAAISDSSAVKQMQAQLDARPAERSAAIHAADAFSIDAQTLLAVYKANEVSADNQFKGKPLKVTGTVEEIKKDFTDEVYVELRTGEVLESVDARGIDPDMAAQLHQGQTVTLLCRGDGMVMNSPQLQDCSVE